VRGFGSGALFSFLRSGDPALSSASSNLIATICVAGGGDVLRALAQEGPLIPRIARTGRPREALRTGGRGSARSSALRRPDDEHDVQCALERLAVLHRSAREAARPRRWSVLELSGRGRGARTTRARGRALAIHHEHRARDLSAAKRYAEALETDATGRFRQEVARRLDRLDRKLSVKKRRETGLNWDAAE
jgi:hypothetical protein